MEYRTRGAKRRLDFYKEDPFPFSAKKMFTPAGVAGTLALQAAGSVIDTVTKRTLGSGGSGAMPVSLTGGQIVKLPPVKFRRGKVKTTTRVSKNCNVAVYRYQMESPWHKPYCANIIANTFNTTSTAVTDGIPRCYPLALYDLTSAPNFIERDTLDLNAVSSTTYPNDPLNRIVTGNAPVCYRPYAMVNYNNTASAADIHRFVEKIGWNTNYDKSVNSCGVPVGNCWQLEYLKKPSKFLANQVINGSGTETDPTNWSKWAWSYGGTAGGYSTNEENVSRVLVPPVGRKPIHRSTNIRLALQGMSSVPCEYTIMVCKFHEDVEPCLGANLKMSKLQSPADVGTAFNSTGNWELAHVKPANANATDTIQNQWIKFWTAFGGQFGDAPGVVDYKILNKYCKVLKMKKVYIDPKASIENDTIGHLRTVSLNLNWNKIRNYGWKNYEPSGNNPVTEVGTTGGPGFATHIDDRNATEPLVHPSQKIFLVVAARVPLEYSETNTTANDVSGNGAFGTLEATKGATYDITIRNTFELDE